MSAPPPPIKMRQIQMQQQAPQYAQGPPQPHVTPQIMMDAKAAPSIQNLMQWTNQDVLNWLASIGLGEIAPAFYHHKIIGADLTIMDKEDMRDMNLPVGPRLRLVNGLKTAQQHAATARRNKVIVEWNESGCCPVLTHCCFLPSYKLTATRLQIYRPGLCASHTNNVDLSSFKDIDVQETCFDSKIIVQANSEMLPPFSIDTEKAGPIIKHLRDAWESDQALSQFKGH